MSQTTWYSMATAALLSATLTSGCSIHTFAAKQLGNALAANGTSFASDDDPQLVGEALPFSLKLMESVLSECPTHAPLLVATSRGFTQYAYGWVGDPARSQRLYLRARDYGMRALELSIDDFRERLASDPYAAVQAAKKGDVPALYWTAASWGLAIANAKDDLDLLADLATVDALILRAAELDSDFDNGAIDTFLITLKGSRSSVSKDLAVQAREHFRRAVATSHGQAAAPFVAAAEALAVPDQDHVEFTRLLTAALAIDPDVRPEWRLQNILSQRRARWLLEHEEDLFVELVAADGGVQ